MNENDLHQNALEHLLMVRAKRIAADAARSTWMSSGRPYQDIRDDYYRALAREDATKAAYVALFGPERVERLVILAYRAERQISAAR